MRVLGSFFANIDLSSYGSEVKSKLQKIEPFLVKLFKEGVSRDNFKKIASDISLNCHIPVSTVANLMTAVVNDRSLYCIIFDHSFFSSSRKTF
jgi:hypothetical protein